MSQEEKKKWNEEKRTGWIIAYVRRSIDRKEAAAYAFEQEGIHEHIPANFRCAPNHDPHRLFTFGVRLNCRLRGASHALQHALDGKDIARPNLPRRKHPDSRLDNERPERHALPHADPSLVFISLVPLDE